MVLFEQDQESGLSLLLTKGKKEGHFFPFIYSCSLYFKKVKIISDNYMHIDC